MKKIVCRLSLIFLCSLIIPGFPAKSQTSRGGHDVRIGSEKGIYKLAFDVDPSTGNMLVAFASYDAVHDIFENYIYFSNDGGINWNRTYKDTIMGIFTSLDCAAFHDYFYVSFTPQIDSTVPRVSRFNMSDGSYDTLYSGKNIDPMGAKVKEICLVSSIDYGDQVAYHYSLLANDSLKLFWGDTLANIDHPINTNIGNAGRGLDACYSPGGMYVIYTSYISSTDSLYIMGKAFLCRHTPLFKDYLGNAPSETLETYKTSISAIGDTIMCIYNFWDNGVTNLKYCYSDDGGSTWATGIIGSSFDTSCMADITLRRGGGIGVIYEEFSGNDVEGIFKWAAYPLGGWTATDTIMDNEPHYYIKPHIEHLEDSIYGIVYVDNDSNKIYFDRIDWVSGIKKPSVEEKASGFLKKQVILFTPGKEIFYHLSEKSKVNISIYNPLGERVKTLIDEAKEPGRFSILWEGKNKKGKSLPAGMYFIQLKTEKTSESRKIAIIK